MTQPLHRRDWLKTMAAGAGTMAFSGWPTMARAGNAPANREKLPVAAVVTEYRVNSHADVIIGKILEGYRQDGGEGPDLKVVSLYTDQVPKNDISRALAEKHGFRICQSIDEAITLGTGQVQVAGVLSIGEHGKYPYVEKTHQHLYPRRRFFDGIATTFRLTGGKVVPVFSDKHLAYNWDDAKHMYDTAKSMQIPFMAGSSLPVAWREPPDVLPIGAEIEAALAVGYGGLESYGFHALEGLQCQVERRKGGETGVKSVQTVTDDALWQAEKEGRWSRELLLAALEASPQKPNKSIEEGLKPGSPFYLVEYNDGLKGCVAMANGLAREFAVALKIKGREKPFAVWYRLEEDKPFGHFEFQVRAIDHMIHTGKPAYPVERTLLVTGILDRAVNSHAEGGRRYETPEFAVEYTPGDWPFANQPEVGPEARKGRPS